MAKAVCDAMNYTCTRNKAVSLFRFIVAWWRAATVHGYGFKDESHFCVFVLTDRLKSFYDFQPSSLLAR
jgi:hypothetical protein